MNEIQGLKPGVREALTAIREIHGTELHYLLGALCALAPGKVLEAVTGVIADRGAVPVRAPGRAAAGPCSGGGCDHVSHAGVTG